MEGVNKCSDEKIQRHLTKITLLIGMLEADL